MTRSVDKSSRIHRDVIACVILEIRGQLDAGDGAIYLLRYRIRSVYTCHERIVRFPDYNRFVCDRSNWLPEPQLQHAIHQHVSLSTGRREFGDGRIDLIKQFIGAHIDCILHAGIARQIRGDSGQIDHAVIPRIDRWRRIRDTVIAIRSWRFVG